MSAGETAGRPGTVTAAQILKVGKVMAFLVAIFVILQATGVLWFEAEAAESRFDLRELRGEIDRGCQTGADDRTLDIAFESDLTIEIRGERTYQATRENGRMVVEEANVCERVEIAGGTIEGQRVTLHLDYRDGNRVIIEQRQ